VISVRIAGGLLTPASPPRSTAALLPPKSVRHHRRHVHDFRPTRDPGALVQQVLPHVRGKAFTSAIVTSAPASPHRCAPPSSRATC
jgi:hypothetical protein